MLVWPTEKVSRTSATSGKNESRALPSPQAEALAAAYRKNPTPGWSWPALQFGQYQGKSFKWLLSNDIGYASMVLAAHQREREGGNTTQSAVMGNKDALLGYAGLFPDVMAAISERRPG